MANATWVKQRGLQAKLGRYWVQGKADQIAWRSPQTPPHVICLIETAAFSPVNNPHTEAVAAAREQIYQSMSRASAYAGGSIYLLFIWGFIQPRSWHKVSPASHKICRWFFNSRRVAPKIFQKQHKMPRTCKRTAYIALRWKRATILFWQSIQAWSLQ